MSKEKYLGESTLVGNPQRKLSLVIRDGSITTDKLKDKAISTQKLADCSVTREKIANDTLGIDKFDRQLRETIIAATGMPEELVNTIQDVDTTLKEHQTTLDDLQTQITSNDDDIHFITKKHTEDINAVNEYVKEVKATMSSIAATGGASVSEAVVYDNTDSKLYATNIQSAIDELVSEVVYLTEDEYEALVNSDSINPRVQYNIIEE